MKITEKATYAAVVAGTAASAGESMAIEEQNTESHTSELVRSPASSSASRHKVHAENRRKHQLQKERRKQYNKKKAYFIGRRRRGRNAIANPDSHTVQAIHDDDTHVDDTHADDTHADDTHADDTHADDTHADDTVHNDPHSPLLDSTATSSEFPSPETFEIQSQDRPPSPSPKSSSPFVMSTNNAAKDKPPEVARGSMMGASLALSDGEVDTQRKVDTRLFDRPEVDDDRESDSESSSSALSSPTALTPVGEGPICRDLRKKNKYRSRGIGHGLRPSEKNKASKVGETSRVDPHSNEDAPQEVAISNVDLPSRDAQTRTQAKKPDLKITVPAARTSESDSSSMAGLSKVLSSNITAVQAEGQHDVNASSASSAKSAPPVIVVSKPEGHTRYGSGETPNPSSSGYSMTSIQPESPYSITPTASPSGYSMKSLPPESPYSSVLVPSATETYTSIPKGAFFWDLTTEGFPCAKAGCQKICAQWDGQSCICPACGPLSKIRYCKKEHLREAVREHWPVCGYFSFQQYVKTSSIQDEVMAGPPMIPSIYNSPSLERHRQALWFSTAQSEGDYFIFSDRAEQITKNLPAGHEDVRCTGKLLVATRWSSSAEKDKFRRCLAVCLLASVHVDDLVDYVYRMIRDNLRSQFEWTHELGEILREQLWLETEVEVEKHYRHACLNEWTGFPPRHCQDPTCVAERKNLLGELGVISGLEHMCQFMEAQHWLLRANRTTHPTCKSIEGRILGEGYGEWVPVQDRTLYRRGEGWDGVGTGPMEYEGPHWR
ncbi:hypothetical protein N7494_009034 [Penicillium frequentans]|uniref:Uncharacterized protein n=1 Tax=Penicillium frequentans TaxID=3151616 RepID=A0AAD6CP21_9EURO|nr:hypothetical protein N7494_009034 [Penicillium glabrum]